MSGTARPEFESGAARRKQGGYLFEEFATARRKNPGGNFFGTAGRALKIVDKPLQLIFERGIGRSRVEFSDNLSELLSPFRFAGAVSVRF